MNAEPGIRREWILGEYDLDATLDCGQAFGWDRAGHAWTGVVHGRWVRLCQEGNRIGAEVAVPEADWSWLEHHLALDEDLGSILGTFPEDGPMRDAMAACRGLRLLRQEPWECLASFICSSTKQIVQIRQIVRMLRERHGERVPVPAGEGAAWAFPTAERIAGLQEGDLRACKLGFRAPYLLAAARRVASGEIDLGRLAGLPVEEAREHLMNLRGVGRKVADCALLFGLGFPTAFPVDVWVRVALRGLYFPRARKVSARRLEEFSATHFGPHGGYAQQYLFHYVRTKLGRSWAARTSRAPTRVKAARARPS